MQNKHCLLSLLTARCIIIVHSISLFLNFLYAALCGLSAWKPSENSRHYVVNRRKNPSLTLQDSSIIMFLLLKETSLKYLLNCLQPLLLVPVVAVRVNTVQRGL